MGNSLEAGDSENTEQLIQKYLITMSDLGQTEANNMKELAFQLNETRFMQVESSKFIVVHKIFLRMYDLEQMGYVEDNFDYINQKIPTRILPYFLLSKSRSRTKDLPICAVTRQHLYQTLEDKQVGGIRMSFEEKLNISLQIIICGLLLHNECKLFHGNISTSNIFLTTDSLVYLGDFAPFKPLFQSKLDEVKLFYPRIYDRSYLAPEKIIEGEPPISQQKYGSFTSEERALVQAMDVFSIGCVLAEIFTDSNPLFNYQGLINYKKGDSSMLEKLNAIQDETVRNMILRMVALDPTQRGTLKEHLEVFKSLICPDMLNLYAYLNYVLRRGEFAHPDVKLGLIRILAPHFIATMDSALSSEERAAVKDSIEDTKFRRCFPYQLSKVSLLSQLKGVTTKTLQEYFPVESLHRFIEQTMASLDADQTRIGSADSPSSIHLDSVKYLKESPLNINQESFLLKDEFKKEEANPAVDLDVKETLFNIISDAQASFKTSITFQKFSPMSHIIEIICSLLRNLQLSQSYQVGLEVMEVFSRFTRSDQTIFLIFPHLLTQLEESENKIEKYYSLTLFCTLVQRIRYVSRLLTNKNAYASYVQAFIDKCKSDAALKNQIFRAIYSFIYFGIIVSTLNGVHKLFDKSGKNPDLNVETGDPRLIVEEFVREYKPDSLHKLFHQDAARDQPKPEARPSKQLAPSSRSEAANMYDYFKDLILINYRNDIGALELIRNLPDTAVFFEVSFLGRIVDETFELYNNIPDTGFRIQAMLSVAKLIPMLDVSSALSKVNKMYDFLVKSSDYTETAGILEALYIAFSAIKLDDKNNESKYIVIEKAIPYMFHPCRLIHHKSLKLISLIFDISTTEEIVSCISPQLKNIASNTQIQDFETLDLIRPRPLSYHQFSSLLSKGGTNLTPAELLVVGYFHQKPKTTKSAARTMLKKKEFKFNRNFSNFIQDVLSSVVIYEALPFDDNMRSELERELSQEVNIDNLNEILSKKLEQQFGNLLVFYPNWQNKAENYQELMKFKQTFVDMEGIIRGDYRFIKQFNLSVLKLCMNYIQMFIHQTRKTFMTERPIDFKNEDSDRMVRMKLWRPSGFLLTSISSHDGPVKCLAPLGENTFASGGSDGHIKYHSLPRLSKNFIHNSIHDINLNAGNEGEQKLKVSQLLSLRQISKLAAITNSSEILIFQQEGKPEVQSRLDTGSRVTAATLYDHGDFRNCIACVNTNCEFLLWDLRQKRPSMSYSLSKIRGVPSSMCKLADEPMNVISTYKGYLMYHDLRTNLIMSSKRLVYERKQMPILSVTQFIRHSRFKNLPEEEDSFLTLTYPSKSNQFSIFQAKTAETNDNPVLHFEQRNETRNSRPIELPILEDRTSKELFLEYDSASQDRYGYLEQLQVDGNGSFRLGNAFYVRTAKDVLGLYTDPAHKTKLDIKQDCLKSFSDVMQTLSSLGDFNKTHNKILNLPTLRKSMSQKIDLDNTILTAGTDRNIRFMNFGPEFEKPGMDEDYESFNSYHLSNVDDTPRSYRYIYSQGTCILKESDWDNKPTAIQLSESYGENGQVIRNPKNGLSYYHNNFLLNKKSSDTLPGHSSSINDLMLMEYNELREGPTRVCSNVVASCSDDGTIKIWM